MLVNLNSSLLDFSFIWLGDGFIVLAAFILSAASLYGKCISQTVDPTVMTGWQLAFGGLVLVAGGYLTGEPRRCTALRPCYSRLSDPAVIHCLFPGAGLFRDPVGE